MIEEQYRRYGLQSRRCPHCGQMTDYGLWCEAGYTERFGEPRLGRDELLANAEELDRLGIVTPARSDDPRWPGWLRDDLGNNRYAGGH